MYAEFVGLTPEAIVLIERLRKSPEETKSEILQRVLGPIALGSRAGDELIDEKFDLGQGVWLRVGEKPMLFLSKDAKQSMKPDGIAEIRADGFYLSGKRIHESPRRALDPAMKSVQKTKGHLNEKGELISHSAWRDWHVLRDGRLLSLFELKDPTLAQKRGRHVRSTLTAEQLGL